MLSVAGNQKVGFLCFRALRMGAGRPSSTRLADTTTLVSTTTRIIFRAAYRSWFALPAHGSNLAIDCAHAQPAGAFAPGILADGPVGRGSRRNVLDVVLDAHDDHARLAAAVNQKALVVLGRPLKDLPEFGAGGWVVVLFETAVRPERVLKEPCRPQYSPYRE